MPTPQEFAVIADQNLIAFITLVVKVFLSLALCLAFMFAFVVGVMYCSAKLLAFGYSLMYTIVGRVQAERKRYEVLS